MFLHDCQLHSLVGSNFKTATREEYGDDCLEIYAFLGAGKL